LVKTALLTGASRGIGRGIALALARQGYGLTITSRNEADLANLATELRAAGAGGVVHVACDMADHPSLARLVDTHRESYGSLRALILNAGVGTAGPLADFATHRLEKMLSVNFTAAALLVRQALPLLHRAAKEDPSDGARIVAISSITGVYPEAGLALYGASKAALISLVETVNLEESAYGVTACALAPGYVDTDMSAWIADAIPRESMIPVDDVVRAVDLALHLSSNTVINRIVLSRAGTTGRHA
jgi:3-oxoacyl-[acyl-carrier protein] reductase